MSCNCFEFLIGAGIGTSLGVYKSEQMKPLYDQIAEKSKVLIFDLQRLSRMRIHFRWCHSHSQSEVINKAVMDK